MISKCEGCGEVAHGSVQRETNCLIDSLRKERSMKFDTKRFRIRVSRLVEITGVKEEVLAQTPILVVAALELAISERDAFKERLDRHENSSQR
jgi:hypothetical protein